MVGRLAGLQQVGGEAVAQRPYGDRFAQTASHTCLLAGPGGSSPADRAVTTRRTLAYLSTAQRFSSMASWSSRAVVAGEWSFHQFHDDQRLAGEVLQAGDSRTKPGPHRH